ncbi:pyridoxamine 5'-phosphate oxidase family protein [Mesorhizobium sp. L-8-3]|uniref:pyridoxamine 5'-phosphate oxidase family protein n=1 Tax=Mesorhizobium sp. L-8-3 TaxID=2744522 RepID=UPI001925873B|nr:pyridoxamine 5'-phosphate oxidase family protein [Mesorhizobium sp. L-8-3]BCH24199.1 hypothetical protein MesoLjLb_39840 [Mesorhizobium sp. L-8-3]
MWIRSLSTPECICLLAANRFAHIACAKDDLPYVVPLYYAYADDHIYAFSAPGKKMEIMRANPQVSILVEERGRGREWQCVIADGRFEELPDRIGHKRERDYAWSLLSQHADWWESGALKPIPSASGFPEIFFRIRVTHLSGRRAKDEATGE